MNASKDLTSIRSSDDVLAAKPLQAGRRWSGYIAEFSSPARASVGYHRSRDSLLPVTRLGLGQFHLIAAKFGLQLLEIAGNCVIACFKAK